MMKNRGKYIIAALLFAVVFCIGALFQRYTAIIQGQNSLFLFTGDYFRETFAASWPLSHLLESFFLQFYEIPMVGPLLNALIVTLIFLLYSFFLTTHKFPFPNCGSFSDSGCCCVSLLQLDIRVNGRDTSYSL
jgi:hypothetical protein